MLSKSLNSQAGWCSIKKPQVINRVAVFQKASTENFMIFRFLHFYIICEIMHHLTIYIVQLLPPVHGETSKTKSPISSGEIDELSKSLNSNGALFWT